jgi:hypothetical protein
MYSLVYKLVELGYALATNALGEKTYIMMSEIEANYCFYRGMSRTSFAVDQLSPVSVHSSMKGSKPTC